MGVGALGFDILLGNASLGGAGAVKGAIEQEMPDAALALAAAQIMVVAAMALVLREILQRHVLVEAGIERIVEQPMR